MKKIMFSDVFALTQAVLDGTKTMTRRILHGTLFWERCPEGMWTDDEIKAWKKEVDQRLIDYSMTDEWPQMKTFAMKHCRYQVGEIVAIAQRYAEIPANCFPNAPFSLDAYKEQAGWNNKLFVSASIMPHHIKITDVRIERLQAISDGDCLREGVIKKWHAPACRNYFYVPNVEVRTKDDVFSTQHEAYAALIDKVSGKGTWLRNPWVVVYEFEKVD